MFGFRVLALAGLTAAGVTPAHDGLKIIASETFPAGAIETTEYVGSDRIRIESRDLSQADDGATRPHADVHIRRCDLNAVVALDLPRLTYQTWPLEMQFNAFERAAFSLRRRHAPPPGPPALIVQTTTVDTGERRIAFGYSARRVITTRRQIAPSNPEASTKTVTDGWYIDLE